MPRAPRAAPSNITVVPPSGTPGAVWLKRIQPERPYPPGPNPGIVRIPVKPLMFQTTELSFCPSYFANRYVNVPREVRFMLVPVPLTAVAPSAVGKEPNRLLEREMDCV